MSAGIENVESIYAPLTDEELVERFRNGDRGSLDALVNTYFPKTYRTVSSFVPESDVADVRQEIFLSFIESLCNFRGKSNFAAWFSSITKRRIADYYRQTSRQRDKLTEDQPAKVDDTWKSIDDELTIRKALREMPERYREILSLKYLEGLSLGEISGKLGLTYEAARSRCRRGMAMLKGKVDGTRPD